MRTLILQPIPGVLGSRSSGTNLNLNHR
uniref:Uncharacterized protein n=1 Tax=Anguilla anguilla TaxID=7936 RepID=A0A0E9SCG4_ANGAN